MYAIKAFRLKSGEKLTPESSLADGGIDEVQLLGHVLTAAKISEL